MACDQGPRVHAPWASLLGPILQKFGVLPVCLQPVAVVWSMPAEAHVSSACSLRSRQHWPLKAGELQLAGNLHTGHQTVDNQKYTDEWAVTADE